ncbi:tRNA preQ1(34) S-adenosylmethionine ribosyltransferase-isomerase QueA [bacterium]|nr:tRNA preQ1(34) S-adenosylmethionine ribosyltransferase-isomerase QueA [bacterium]
MKLEEFDYSLPKELIAQKPVFPRDHSRLMVLEKESGKIKHHYFYELPELLEENWVLVFNNSRVIPARLEGKKPTGGKVEVLFLRQRQDKVWEVLAKGRLKPGQKVFLEGVELQFVRFKEKEKVWEVEVSCSRKEIERLFERKGKTPLPPYITARIPESKARRWYQSIFAQKPGSVAGPTASFHFTPRLLEKLRQKGIEFAFVTLHVGWGTFAPIRTEKIEEHRLHPEEVEVSSETARFLNHARSEGKKILAVGTTVVRALETAADKNGKLCPFRGETTLYIYPPYRFKVINGLITNFHLPRSSLLVLVSAFAGTELIKRAYKEAIKKRYRFFSFGDAMLIK